MSGRKSPARTGRPLSGSTRLVKAMLEILIGWLQVRPASLEIITASKNWFAEGWRPDPRNSVNTSTSVPSGSTTIWFPIVKMFVLAIPTGVDHDAPPLVVRENIGWPRYANEWNVAIGAIRSLGKLPRSQTAYT